jgi:hypothetical protein
MDIPPFNSRGDDDPFVKIIKELTIAVYYPHG